MSYSNCPVECCAVRRELRGSALIAACVVFPVAESGLGIRAGPGRPCWGSTAVSRFCAAVRWGGYASTGCVLGVDKGVVGFGHPSQPPRSSVAMCAAVCQRHFWRAIRSVVGFW